MCYHYLCTSKSCNARSQWISLSLSQQPALYVYTTSLYLTIDVIKCISYVFLPLFIPIRSVIPVETRVRIFCRRKWIMFSVVNCWDFFLFNSYLFIEPVFYIIRRNRLRFVFEQAEITHFNCWVVGKIKEFAWIAMIVCVIRAPNKTIENQWLQQIETKKVKRFASN